MAESLTTPMTLDSDGKAEFVELLEAHRGIAVKVASTYCWHPDDRAELMQEIAAQLWFAYPKFDAARSFSTWMYRIALNVAISYVRKHSLRQRYHADCGPDPDELPAAATGDDRMDFLLRFIDRLGPFDRALMVLYLEERSYREIADVLGISETNVASKISRLKKRVRVESERPGSRQE